jgi:hypothetical protein
MTNDDKPKLIAMIHGYWDSWRVDNRQKNLEACKLFAQWKLGEIENAILEARQRKAKPDEQIFDTLLRAQTILRSKARAPRIDWIEQRLEEHRQHYAGNRASGLEWPGDEAVRRMILAAQDTPLQVWCRKRLVAGWRARVANKESK